jgi:hypothetical protein
VDDVTPAFLTAPDLKQVGPELWELQAELVYRSALLGIIRIPQGCRTDKATVPRLPFMYWAVGARGDGPAIVHDWLYRARCHGNLPVSRAKADAVFYEALGAPMPWGQVAEPGWAQIIMWLGVRAFGWWPWWRRDQRIERLGACA